MVLVMTRYVIWAVVLSVCPYWEFMFEEVSTHVGIVYEIVYAEVYP